MMKESTNVVSLREDAGSEVQNARVESVSGKEAVIRISGLTLPARVAFSCLIRPMPEDLVLCAKHETGKYYILGIIERPGSQDMVISFPADAAMVARDGAMSMVAGQSVTLVSGDRLSFFSETAIHKSREAVVDYDELTARGTTLRANFNSVFVVGRLISTMAVQAIQKFKNFIRHTEDYDQVKAGQMTRNVDGLYSMDSKHTIMVSKKDTKIDGERIHMG